MEKQKGIKPDAIEYENRLDEILSLEVTTQKEDINTFFDKIGAWVRFMENSKTYRRKIKEIYNDPRSNKIFTKLEVKKNEIVKECGRMLSHAEKVIKQNNIVLPTALEVWKRHPNGGFSPTVDEALGENMDFLKNKLSEPKRIRISEVSGVITNTKRIKWDFDTLGITPSFTEEQMEKVSKLDSDYEKLEKKYDAERKYLGQIECDTILGIGELLDGEDVSDRQIYGIFSSPAFWVINPKQSIRSHATPEEILSDIGRYKSYVRSVDKRLEEISAKKANRWFIVLAIGVLSLLGIFFSWVLKIVAESAIQNFINWFLSE